MEIPPATSQQRHAQRRHWWTLLGRGGNASSPLVYMLSPADGYSFADGFVVCATFQQIIIPPEGAATSRNAHACARVDVILRAHIQGLNVPFNLKEVLRAAACLERE
eukprot:710975-Prymnesium_polylepis.1